jgi:hypothetical protein
VRTAPPRQPPQEDAIYTTNATRVCIVNEAGDNALCMFKRICLHEQGVCWQLYEGQAFKKLLQAAAIIVRTSHSCKVLVGETH